MPRRPTPLSIMIEPDTMFVGPMEISMKLMEDAVRFNIVVSLGYAMAWGLTPTIAWAQDKAEAKEGVCSSIKNGEFPPLTVLLPEEGAANLQARGLIVSPCGDKEDAAAYFSKNICLVSSKWPVKINTAFEKTYLISAAELCEIVKDVKYTPKEKTFAQQWYDRAKSF